MEPNAPMREAAEAALCGYPTFHSIDGTAEATTLADRSMHLITSAQAFHWFERSSTAREFHRILRPGGAVAIIWNERRRAGDPFCEGYNALLDQHGTDYKQVAAFQTSTEDLAALFEMPFQRITFPNEQLLDRDGLLGRLMSASYVPRPGQPGHEPLMSAARELFDRHQRDGQVRIVYDTEVFFGSATVHSHIGQT